MQIDTVSLKDYSSLRIGGSGHMVVVKDIEELKEALMHAKSEGLRVHFVGGGTNSYFGEELDTFLFITMEVKGIEVQSLDQDTVLLTAQASEVWDDVVTYAVKQGLWGIENLSYIPGSVGAAPVQNIGAYGVELAQVFESLVALDIQTQELISFNQEECRFGYRDSVFKYNSGKYVIMSVTLRLRTVPCPVLLYKPLDELAMIEDLTLTMIRDKVIEVRTHKLPDWKGNPNAGSFFKNTIVDIGAGSLLCGAHPEIPLIEVEGGYKIPTAWLIEHIAGMKGVRNGDIGTWPHQPLVLVNYGSATADDLDAFAKEIKDKIYIKTGITIEQEVNRIG